MFAESDRRTRVLIAADSSGGHLYPALAFAQALSEKKSSLDAYFVTGPRKISPDLFKELAPDRVVRLAARPYRGLRSFVWPPFLMSLVSDFLAALKVLRHLRPHLAVGFGGLASVPIILSARLLRIKTLIHEQNAEFGLANRLLSHVANRVTSAFGEPARKRRRVIKAGMPLRRDLKVLDREAALSLLGLSPEKKTLALIGGSQGSRFLNQVIQSLLGRYGSRLSSRWQVVHLSGPRDYETSARFYAASSVRGAVFSFYEDISVVYSAADLVISRSGALTLHELAYFKKGAVLVPYPGARGHQSTNAGFLSDNGGAIRIRQRGLSPERLLEIMEEAERDPERFERMGERCAVLLDIRGADALALEAQDLLGA